MGNELIEKVSIIISKGSLDGVYPGLIMANGARAEGIEANLFFTFFGLDVVHRKRHEHIKMATVGNPGLHMATWLGGSTSTYSTVMFKPFLAFTQTCTLAAAWVAPCKNLISRKNGSHFRRRS